MWQGRILGSRPLRYSLLMLNRPGCLIRLYNLLPSQSECDVQCPLVAGIPAPQTEAGRVAECNLGFLSSPSAFPYSRSTTLVAAPTGIMLRSQRAWCARNIDVASSIRFPASRSHCCSLPTLSALIFRHSAQVKPIDALKVSNLASSICRDRYVNHIRSSP